MSNLQSALQTLESERLYARAISIDRLDDIRHDIEDLRSSGQIDEKFYSAELQDFSFSVPEDFPNAQSIVVVAVPQPMYTITFCRKGKAVPTILPPTFADGEKIVRLVQDKLHLTLPGSSFVSCKGTLPYKTLASRSGLTRYGRNNLAYLGKHGSFIRLTAFYSDRPTDEDIWHERLALPTCSKCRACVDACPTRAISEERFLVGAERCITYLNEMPPEIAFPDWVKPEWHNAIIGCMFCQKACPHNSSVLSWNEKRASFDDQETEYLLAGDFHGEAAERMDAKLRSMGLDLASFPRNLAALMR